MAELVREMLIDAGPETIFEFLTVPEKHMEWMGTKVALNPPRWQLPGVRGWSPSLPR